MLTGVTPAAAVPDVSATAAAEVRAAARAGDLGRAWSMLLAATGAAGPVLGPHGHGLHPDPAGGELTAGGTGWRVLRAAGPDNRPSGWPSALLWWRLGASEGLLAQAVEHLRGRTTGGAPLIQQQLVRGNLADAVIAQQEVLGLLPAASAGAPPPEHLHAQLTRADRTTLRLFGASGFLADGPGEAGYLSELLADAYLDAERGSADDRA
jgi:hypothetical protein